ncbi:NAD(P)H-dependent glycerol-3-phosphate dehydrogenase [Rickettsia akari str. Hartford]|uniref:NAD(P)H-dependent glycerol-3-phosphate dehydrogenase n=1 Tax=Rickettsia akari (strain Hartford) TaxID=293614 RepID=A8GNH2_RICAH|nr:NAD(P)H-dependent glycerol-3-phosphate dehydrogenase [Rickettsia akari str. Hartford]
MDTLAIIARNEAMRQSRKIIKKILIYRLFYWIASSNYDVILLAMVENWSTKATPRRNDTNINLQATKKKSNE